MLRLGKAELVISVHWLPGVETSWETRASWLAITRPRTISWAE